ncbi:MAG: regulatory protein RecX, partial [Propionibacteriaceae bacterium]
MGTDPGPGGTSLGAAEVDLREVDQVAAAREWLRSHGVDPDDLEAPRTTGPGSEREGVAEAGYGRSRRAGPAGSGGRSLSRRRAPAGEPDDAEDEAAGAGKADADPEQVAREIVLRKLAVQARTRVELERALAGREVPEEAAATVLDRMTEVGLIDDATFAHDWVVSRQQRRHLSKMALRRELQTKGVDREVIDAALADVEGGDEHRAALDLAQRRART